MRDMKDDILNKTIRSLETSLEKYPDNVQMLTSLTELHLKSDMLGLKTLRLLERLSDLTPENLRIHRVLSICYLIQQPTDLANNISELTGIDVQALTETRNRLDTLKSQHDRSADLYKALGDVNLFLKYPEEAVASYSTAIQLGYEDYPIILKSFSIAHRSYLLPPVALSLYAFFYDKAGMPEKAAELYRCLIKDGVADKQSVVWLIKYLETLVAVESDMDVSPDHKIELIDLYMNNDKTNEAIELARTLNIEELGDCSIIKKIARHFMDVEDYRQAFDFLSHIPLDTENKALINEIALRLERHGELDTAVYLLQFINAHDLVIVEAQAREDKELKIHTELGLAELHFKNKKWASALEKYIGILKVGYEDWQWVMDRIDQILQSMEKPSLANFVFCGDFFFSHGDLKKAAAYFSRSLEIYPGVREIQIKLRNIYDQQLAVNPQLPDVMLLYGDLCLSMGETDKAIGEYQEAANFPEFAIKASRRLARAYMNIGEYALALDRYMMLGEILSSEYKDLINLYEKLLERNMLKEAFEALRLIYNRDPEYGDVATLMKKLEEKIQSQEGAEASIFIDPKMHELIGDHAIGRYKYVEKIGSGGMGVVHRIFDIKNNCFVAMKILREGLSGSGKAIDRFFREARIAATLNHKNIVRIYDYNISNVYGQSYITMSFVDGPSLRDIIEERFAESLDITTIEVAQTLRYMSQLCEALECAHNHGIIHRDIKPDNIMIDKDDEVKITDFGIVHIEEASFTPTGSMIGTPRYMSPEQVRGGKIDGRSDIYSVGIITYELLVGSPPFISGDIAYQQVNVKPTPPREISPAIPESINAIIMKCLTKSPDDRYQSAPELRTVLDAVLQEIGGYHPSEREKEESKKAKDDRNISDSGHEHTVQT
jgi:tetratricopeptide (TPR) repeat protein